MSYIEKAKQNQMMAEKAAAFDRMRQNEMQQQAYNQGSNDVYSEVDRVLRARRPRETVDLRGAAGEWRSDPKNQALIEEAAKRGYWDPQQDPTGDIEAVHRMVFDKEKSSNEGLAGSMANPRSY